MKHPPPRMSRAVRKRVTYGLGTDRVPHASLEVVLRLLESPEVTDVIHEIAGARRTGRPLRVSVRELVGLSIAQRVWCLPTWRGLLEFLATREDLRAALIAADLPSEWTCYRFARNHGDQILAAMESRRRREQSRKEIRRPVVRMPPPRLLSPEEQEELAALTAQQRHEEHRRWASHGELPPGTSSPRFTVSLDLPMELGDGAAPTLGELLPDPTPIGGLGALMVLNVENTLAAAKNRRVNVLPREAA